MTTTATPDRAQRLLTAAYDGLGFVDGALVPTSSSPQGSTTNEDWRNIGEWLILGQRVGAERVFFVGEDPVVLFSELHAGAGEADFVAAYRRAWSLGRARCLFIATAGELRVYSLTQPPPRTLSDAEPLTNHDVVTRAAEVAERLATYHRDRIESGLLFEEERYLNSKGRADQRFLQDVRAATDALARHGLSRPLAHALIERVILIRYLEDRKVIGPEYFFSVAEQHSDWSRDIAVEFSTPSLGAQSTFIPCLSSRDLSYAVFEALAADFNGDLFIVSPEEAQAVTVDHLELIQRLLTGVGVDGREALFLWAYDFSVVPTSLISEMYEQFYSAGSEDESSTHYTPQELVEYVLAHALTPKVLSEKPRVCDPACGSGIFLVEAFRRIVRNEMVERGERLSPERMRTLLMERIAGIDINSEAIRLAAFSLYLAYLNYLDPSDIRGAGPLPRLVYRSGDPPNTAVLAVADAFAPTLSELNISPGSNKTISQPGSLRQATLPWHEGDFGVIVGNPPWGSPKGGQSSTADSWAEDNELPVGDRNPSLLFMWRALYLLRPGGTAAMLVGATPFHNIRSKEFRREWLSVVDLESVINFSIARRLFFAKAVAPFLLVNFRRPSGQARPASVLYRTIRPSVALSATRSPAYATSERRWVGKDELRKRDYLWKTYAWGSHRDATLMARLDAEQSLRDILPSDPRPGWGYQYGPQEPSPFLKSLPSLRHFDPWGPLTEDSFEVLSRGVKRQPDERRYSGQRIVVSRGVRTGFGPVARLLDIPCSFRHTIYCLPLPTMPTWQAKVILGVLLSSLGRYRLFMHSGSWGLWHDQVTAEDILCLPVRLTGPEDPTVRSIVAVVDSLVSWPHADSTLPEYGDRSKEQPLRLLRTIDEGVFDLFELSSSERDLIKDFHAYTLGLLGDWRTSAGLKDVSVPQVAYGTIRDIEQIQEEPLQQYLYRFLTEWNRELGPTGEFTWHLVSSVESGMVAAIFETHLQGSAPSTIVDQNAWQAVLDRLSGTLMTRISPTVMSDGVLRSVSDTSIILVKRSEARLWTATAALEDAEATMLQAMRLQES